MGEIKAVNTFVGAFPLERDDPDFVGKVLRARNAFNALTNEQKLLVNVELVDELERATLEALETQ